MTDGLKETGIFDPDLERKLQILKDSVLEDVNASLTQSFKRLLEGQNKEGHRETKDRSNAAAFREKVFVCRNSALTDLWNISHMRSAYNICTALFIVLVMNTCLYYAASPTKFWADIHFLSWSFGNVSVWSSTVILMHVALLCVFYPSLKYWAFSRIPSPKITYYDVMFLLLYIIFQGLFLMIPTLVLLSYDLSPVSNCIVVMEETRLLMKNYAFFRENLSRVLHFKPHQDNDENNETKEPCPDFQKFLYFLFVPTLVYRDNYPRTKSVDWQKVVGLFFQVLACILTPFIAFQRFVVEMFDRAGREPFQIDVVIFIYSGCVVVGSIFMFCGFYGLLHCWMNLFAEVLRFGDRVFYSDWWNSTSFHKYYRTWNTVVHDWLYAYLYRDLLKVFRGSQNLSLMMVFLISAVMHEYIIALCMGFFYPVLFIMMLTFGVWVVHLTRNKTSDLWNVFLWFAVCAGWGILFMLYCYEYYARKNCPKNYEGFKDYFTPRSWSCIRLQMSFSRG